MSPQPLGPSTWVRITIWPDGGGWRAKLEWDRGHWVGHGASSAAALADLGTRGETAARLLDMAQGREGRPGTPITPASLAAAAHHGKPHQWDEGGACEACGALITELPGGEDDPSKW